MFYALIFFLLGAGVATASPPLAVVTTSTDLKALVEAVGGERVKAENLAPPLHDPHALEIKAGQLAKIKSCALLVRIGLDHEPWLTRALRTVNDPRFSRQSPHYLDTSERIQLLQSETPRLRADKGSHLHGFGNTHYWLDPENSRPVTEAILQSLSRLAPTDRLYFETNRNRFLEELAKRLGSWHQAMAPHRGTRVVTVHDTWPYFAQRFGLMIAGVVEPTPGVPPAPAYLASLTQKMREAGIKLIIAEPYSDSSLLNHLAARSGATAITLIPSVGGDPEASDYLRLFDVDIKRLSQGAASAR